MISRLASYVKNNRGQSIVELALALPIMILLVAGIIEFGLMLNQYLVVAEAAREGARSAALGDDDITIIATAKTAAAAINAENLTVTVTPTTRLRGDPATVTVSNKVQIITPIISSLFPQNPVTVTGIAVMRVE